MSALLSGLLPYIIAGAGILATLAGVWFKGRSSGVQSERTKQAAAEKAARDVSDQVDNDVGAMPPKDAREELKRWQKLLQSR